MTSANLAVQGAVVAKIIASTAHKPTYMYMQLTTRLWFPRMGLLFQGFLVGMDDEAPPGANPHDRRNKCAPILEDLLWKIAYLTIIRLSGPDNWRAAF